MACRHYLGGILAISFCFTVGMVSAQGLSRPQHTIPVEGEPFEARLAGIDADWNLTFITGQQRRQMAGAKLARWGAQHDWRKGRLILLVDGSMIAAKRLKITGRHLVVSSNLWDGAKVPLEMVRGIIFRPPADMLSRDRLIRKITTTRQGKDRLLLENGDVIRGVFIEGSQEKSRSPAVADPFDDDQRLVHLRTDSGPVAVSVERVIALTFNPTLLGQAKSIRTAVLVGFRDGSSLHAEKIESDNDQVTWKLAGGISLTTDPLLESVWDEVVSLQPKSPRVVYLSDLKPIGYKHIPFLELSWPYEVDRNVQGGALRSGERVYAKGIGMHSTSRLAYDLDDDYRKFQAHLAIDQLAGRKGSVVFRVYLAESNKWRLAYESPIVRGRQKPLPVTVDVSKASRMALIVDMSDRGDEWDHANWLDARLVK